MDEENAEEAGASFAIDIDTIDKHSGNFVALLSIPGVGADGAHSKQHSGNFVALPACAFAGDTIAIHHLPGVGAVGADTGTAAAGIAIAVC